MKLCSEGDEKIDRRERQKVIVIILVTLSNLTHHMRIKENNVTTLSQYPQTSGIMQTSHMTWEVFLNKLLVRIGSHIFVLFCTSTLSSRRNAVHYNVDAESRLQDHCNFSFQARIFQYSLRKQQKKTWKHFTSGNRAETLLVFSSLAEERRNAGTLHQRSLPPCGASGICFSNISGG